MEILIDTLKKLKGVTQVRVLDNTHKEELFLLEEERNLGVRECLKRKTVLILLHNSDFRDPIGSLVLKNKKSILFPPLPFPELGAKNVVSASPSKEVHTFLVEQYLLKKESELATVLIGFD